VACKVHAEAQHDDVIPPLEQDAGELAAIEQQIIGPFDRQPRRRRELAGRIVQRDGGEQRQCLGGRVSAPQADEAADVQIAGCRGPIPALPAPPRGLALGAQPQPLGLAGGGALGNGVVGRADLREADVADRRDGGGRAQGSSALAASIVAALSDGMAR
jgi:hypothetical protein